MKPAGIYRRISKDREGRMLGVGRQEEDCLALAGRLGLEVVDVYTDDDISASTRSRKARPEYRRLLVDARAGRIHYVLAYTSGRLTRRPRELEDQIELAEHYGVRFHYVASPDFDLNTSAGRRVARILAANDAGEAEDISERAKREKVQKAAAGRWLGGRRPYGYEVDGTTVRADEAEVLRWMAGEILAGGSIRQTTIKLNNRGLTTSTGRPWRDDAVRGVLLRPRNAGLMEHLGKVVGPAMWEPILEEDQWRGVVAVLTAPGRLTHLSSARRWLLSGIALCGLCGHLCRAHAGGRPGMPEVYTCRAGKHVARAAVHLDEWVTDLVLTRLAEGQLSVPDAGADIAAAHAELLSVRERLDALGVAFGAGEIDAGQMKAATAQLRVRQDAAEQVIGRASSGNALASVLGAADVRAHWADLTLDRRRGIIRALMTIRLLPARRGRRPGWRAGESYFDPDAVDVAWK